MALHLLAQIAVPSAGKCLRLAAPVAAILALGWVIRHSDELIRRWLPHLEWERQLGWFNIRSELRAAAALRWIGYVVYTGLALALVGILWSAIGLGELQRPDNPEMLSEFPGRLPVLFASLGLWALYLGGHLLPRLRHEYEEEELARYRAEIAQLESESEEQPALRSAKGPLLSPKLSPSQRSTQPTTAAKIINRRDLRR